MIKTVKGELTVDFISLMLTIINIGCLIRWIFRLFTRNEYFYVDIIFTLIFTGLLIVGLKLTFKYKKI
jgi:hypothetical protein